MGEMRDRHPRDEAFSEFFAQEAERLRRIAFFLTGDIDGAADLAQDALAATYRRWHKKRSGRQQRRRTAVPLLGELRVVDYRLDTSHDADANSYEAAVILELSDGSRNVRQ